MYGPLVIAYLFLGGTAGGGFLAMSVSSLIFEQKEHSLRLQQAFMRLRLIAYTICLVLLAFAMICLLWDLERPERVLILFLKPHATVLTVGAFTLLIETVLGVLLILNEILRNKHIGSGKLRLILEVLCLVNSFTTIAYTGVFLASNAAVPFWNSPTLVAVFVFSALSNGLSLMLLIDYFIKGQTILLHAAKPLQICHIACLTAETASIAFFTFEAFSNPAAQGAIELLLSSNVLSTAIIGVLGFGIAAPAILEIYSLSQKETRTIPVSDIMCLFGGVCLRYCVITCGIH